MSDEDILAAGGTQEDISSYAHDVGGACGAAYGGKCGYPRCKADNTEDVERNYIHISEQDDRELYGDEYELRLLLKDAKRKAVSMFKNDHDDGDTAIYQFISEAIPIFQQEANRRVAEAIENIKGESDLDDSYEIPRLIVPKPYIEFLESKLQAEREQLEGEK